MTGMQLLHAAQCLCPKLFILKRKLTFVSSYVFYRMLNISFVTEQTACRCLVCGAELISRQKFQLRALATMKSRNTFSLAAFFISLG